MEPRYVQSTRPEEGAVAVRSYANPTPLGFAGFSITLWMVGMVYAGWFPDADLARDVMLAITFGGTVMAIAGILEFFKSRTFEMMLFLVFSAYWWSWALGPNLAGAAPQAGVIFSAYTGWYYLVWALFAFFLWVDAFRESRASMAFTLGLWLTFLALAIGEFAASTGFVMLGGYLGLITALIGAYTSAAELINTNYGRTLLPIGSPIEHR
ncbi:acetate uptake transporter [Methylocaldum sp. MU1018]